MNLTSNNKPPKYVVHHLTGNYTNENGKPVDAVIITATEDVIADDGTGIATGIPADKYEKGHIVTPDGGTMYALTIDQAKGRKYWKKVEA